MSLGAPRSEKDKQGVGCWAAEVAVNSVWFDDVMKQSEAFTAFVITVAMEGLADKYGEEARLDRDSWTVLKNKKAQGDKLPAHRIQQRGQAGIQDIGETGDSAATGITATSTVKSKTVSATPRPERLKEKPVNDEVEPKFRVVAEPNKRKPSR